MSSPINVRLAAGWLARRTRELAELPVARHSAAPPRRLRARTGAPGAREFVEGGLGAAHQLGAVLPNGFAGFGAVLDFGCGSARVLPHVAALAARARCCGCDVDAAAIAWASAHHPGLDFTVSRAEPPLPFPDGAFDLVYSVSVLSHLDASGQDRWLAELARVIADGGTALLSVHGAHAFEQFRSGAARTSWCPLGAFARGPLAADEYAFVPYSRTIWNRGELPGVAASYGLAFHGEEYVRSRWGRWFAVEQVAPHALTGWQDIVRLTRPAR